MNKKPIQTDYAYIAGYIDGDGCFSISRFKKRSRFKERNRLSPKFPMSIIISSVNKEILEWAKDLFGGSISKNTSIHKKHKPLYIYTLRKSKSIPLTKLLLDHLIEKTEEAYCFIDFGDTDCSKTKNSILSEMRLLKNTRNLISKNHKRKFETTRNTIVPTVNDFAYLAGFIDAECSFGIQKYKPKNRPNFVYKIILQYNDTKTHIFEWLLKRFGGQIHFIDRTNHEKAIKNQLTWRLSGRALSKILKDIYPFLKHKKPVCEELIKFYETTLPNGGARHTEAFRTAYAAVLQKREKIVSKIHKLNLKGL